MALRVEPELRKAFQKYGFKAGFLKLSILKIVSLTPTHGYALMKEIERLTEEDWRPSPGSIYPALQDLLKDELIVSRKEGRRKIYEITPKGEQVLLIAVEHASIALRHLNRLLSL
jgi:DNA-binding PadR family transcriptional regulator